MANLWQPPFDPSRELIVRRAGLLWKGRRYEVGQRFEKRHATIRQQKMLYEQRALSYPDQGGSRKSEGAITPEKLQVKAAMMLGAKAPQSPVEVPSDGLGGVEAMVAAYTKAQLLENAKAARLDVSNAMNKVQIATLILESRNGAA